MSDGDETNGHGTGGSTRREMLGQSGGLLAALTLTGADAATAEAATADSAQAAGAHAVRVTMRVNGRIQKLTLDSRTSLLDALRDHVGLTGTKKGCDQGQCGACSVHVNGRRVVSCLMMAAQADGRQVKTIEGLEGPNGELHPLQQAFIDNDGAQCGYCTPGQIMSGVMCVREGHADSLEEIRESMSGNLCRCGCYVGITAAIQQAAPAIRKGG